MVGPPSQPAKPPAGICMSDRPVRRLSPSSPPQSWQPLLRFARRIGAPLRRILQLESASGILLLVSAALALVWANSAWTASYADLWHTRIGVHIGSFVLERSLEWWVNDGLMVIFFFSVGLEIRAELHHGALSEWKRAALPAAAAAGGMCLPAALYLALAGTPPTRSGWGVPMATDIAFALGILALLGKRVPAPLRILLLALAVIDDVGAIIVIAIFYSSEVALSGLVVAALAIGVVLGMQRCGVRSKVAYALPAVIAWAGVYRAGIHPTIAGVILGLITPVHERPEPLHRVDVTQREDRSPAESLIRTLRPWVAFVIMPIFALANAGVVIPRSSLDTASVRVVAAVSAGLVFGKPIGVLTASWLVLRLRLGTLPPGVTFRHLVVLGVLAGVGFTMALFIAQLAFRDAQLLNAARIGVLAASGAAAVLGLLMGRALLRAGPAIPPIESE